MHALSTPASSKSTNELDDLASDEILDKLPRLLKRLRDVSSDGELSVEVRPGWTVVSEEGNALARTWPQQGRMVTDHLADLDAVTVAGDGRRKDGIEFTALTLGHGGRGGWMGWNRMMMVEEGPERSAGLRFVAGPGQPETRGGGRRTRRSEPILIPFPLHPLPPFRGILPCPSLSPPRLAETERPTSSTTRESSVGKASSSIQTSPSIDLVRSGSIYAASTTRPLYSPPRPSRQDFPHLNPAHALSSWSHVSQHLELKDSTCRCR